MQAAGQRQSSIALPAVPRSVGDARDFVRNLLAEVDRGRWVDAAVLIVSELFTNAVIHSHSPAVRLTGRVEDDHVRLEVRDSNPALPAARDYDEFASTGRGLELVAALSMAHGVESLGAEGKVVWVCVGDTAAADERSEDELLAEWDETGDFSSSADLSEEPARDAVTVVLRSMPATLWLAAREHHDALLRELVLLQAGGPEDPGWLAGDLAAADAARTTIGSALDVEVQHARDSGAAAAPLPEYHPAALPAVPEKLDLELRVRPEHAGRFLELQDVLDAGERLAAADRLLVRPGLPEIVAVRDWAAEQVIAQLTGSPPAPWPGADDERFLADVDHAVAVPGWDPTAVTEADVGAIAVDEGNRIVAVSVPLAEVLGWLPQDLVGRRVVAIVPPRFREAHVAGFSRHLSTGDARALGAQLQLPVLTAAGAEVDCHFLIESEPTVSGRVVYRAWITPVQN